MHRLEIDGCTYLYNNIEMDLGSLDVIAWLSHQEIYPKVFWKDRDQEVVCVGLGSILHFDHTPHISASAIDVRFYGGMHFDPLSQKQEEWNDFPLSGFWLPQFEIVQTKEKTALFIHSINAPCNRDLLRLLSFETTPLSKSDLGYLKISEFPNEEQWHQNVKTVLEEIETEAVEKIVLARKTQIDLPESPSVWAILEELRQKAFAVTLFAFQMEANCAFLGATPEKLFSRSEQTLQIDAVAGTRLRGKTFEEDLQIEEELLENGKDLREFFIVKEFLTSILLPYVDKMQWEVEDSVLKNTHVQHLYNRLSVHLKQEIKDSELIEMLHPTPALGGFPKEKSLFYIRECECFDRGWYGAPVGYISSKESSFAVAIRSALIKDKAIHLFSGVGIVKGSDAAFEWEELNQKIQPFISLLQEKIEEVYYG